MSCCHYTLVEGNESAFAVDPSTIAFGTGVLAEAGEHLRALSCRRVALFTDGTLARLEPVATVLGSLRAAGLDVAVYDDVHVEPTDASFRAAAEFATAGGSTGTSRSAAARSSTPARPPSSTRRTPRSSARTSTRPSARASPSPVLFPRTSRVRRRAGTGSECTGIAVFDHLSLKVKTGIASRRLRPTLALIDPTCTRTLPAMVVAASGFDVLCHALESYTARPFTARPRPDKPSARPMSQGRNPWSDVGSMEALRLAGGTSSAR